MKYNLKNRPHFDLEGGWEEGISKYHMECEMWFDDFERELREEIAYLKSMEPEELYDYIHDKKFERGVLGE